MNMTPPTIFSVSVSATALLVPLLCLAQVTRQTPVKPPAVPATPTPVAHAAMDPGERAFNANCFRCHQAPETLNPRITGTVVRHMRVRANLSAQDERDILHYLNP